MADAAAEARKMTTEAREMTAEARQVDIPDEVADARRALQESRRAAHAELDELGAAVRRSLDFPAKIRRDPVRTLGIVGGAAFLLLGGPRRVAAVVEKRFFPRRAKRPPRLLPKDVDKTLDRLEPGDRDYVRGHLERDFAAYLRKEHPTEPADARRSLWKTYDLMLSIVGAAAARELVKKLFEVPKEVRVEEAAEKASVDVAAEEAKADAKTEARS